MDAIPENWEDAAGSYKPLTDPAAMRRGMPGHRKGSDDGEAGWGAAADQVQYFSRASVPGMMKDPGGFANAVPAGPGLAVPLKLGAIPPGGEILNRPMVPPGFGAPSVTSGADKAVNNVNIHLPSLEPDLPLLSDEGKAAEGADKFADAVAPASAKDEHENTEAVDQDPKRGGSAPPAHAPSAAMAAPPGFAPARPSQWRVQRGAPEGERDAAASARPGFVPPAPTPRGPDGTKGFKAGRGRPLAPPASPMAAPAQLGRERERDAGEGPRVIGADLWEGERQKLAGENARMQTELGEARAELKRLQHELFEATFSCAQLEAEHEAKSKERPEDPPKHPHVEEHTQTEGGGGGGGGARAGGAAGGAPVAANGTRGGPHGAEEGGAAETEAAAAAVAEREGQQQEKARMDAVVAKLQGEVAQERGRVEELVGQMESLSMAKQGKCENCKQLEDHLRRLLVHCEQMQADSAARREEAAAVDVGDMLRRAADNRRVQDCERRAGVAEEAARRAAAEAAEVRASFQQLWQRCRELERYRELAQRDAAAAAMGGGQFPAAIPAPAARAAPAGLDNPLAQQQQILLQELQRQRRSAAGSPGPAHAPPSSAAAAASLFAALGLGGMTPRPDSNAQFAPPPPKPSSPPPEPAEALRASTPRLSASGWSGSRRARRHRRRRRRRHRHRHRHRRRRRRRRRGRGSGGGCGRSPGGWSRGWHCRTGGGTGGSGGRGRWRTGASGGGRRCGRRSCRRAGEGGEGGRGAGRFGMCLGRGVGGGGRRGGRQGGEGEGGSGVLRGRMGGRGGGGRGKCRRT